MHFASPPFHQHFIPPINPADISLLNIGIYHIKYITVGFLCSPLNGCGRFCGQRAASRPNPGTVFWPTNSTPRAQLYFGLYFGQLAQRPANDVSDRNWGDVGGVGGLFRMKRLLISTTVPIWSWSDIPSFHNH